MLQDGFVEIIKEISTIQSLYYVYDTEYCSHVHFYDQTNSDVIKGRNPKCKPSLKVLVFVHWVYGFLL